MQTSVTNLVGIHGSIGAGKSTITSILHDLYDFADFKFASPVYSAYLATNPWVCVAEFHNLRSLFGEYVRLKDLVAYLGWEKAKEVPDVRAGLQKTGTEAGRDIHGKDCWVDIARDVWVDALATRVCFSDMRFRNERDFIADSGGLCVKVVGPSRRASTAEATKHLSEAGLPDELFHFVIYNTGTIEELQDHVVKAVMQPVPHETIYLGVQQ